MRGILFAAPKSGSGKTLITCGFLEALKRRGLHPAAFKCGPDYIDPMFHQYVLGIPRRKPGQLFSRQRRGQTDVCRKNEGNRG